MRQIISLLLPLLLSTQAFADAPSKVDDSGALALAALVAENSPLIGAADKAVLAKLLDGETNVTYPAGQKISLTAAKLTCKASNVDIAAHSCDLTFGGKDVTLNGRRAHELFATLAGIGVEPDGAAGSIYEALANLKCTVDPNEVKQMAGGGAHCDFAPAD
jgi:hypothetical protein